MIPTPRKNQAASAKRRVAEIHSASTRRTTSAPTANAKGTANSVYPEYSIGGWIIMLGWRSSAFSPMPSCGGFGSSVNGLAANTSSPPKNAPKPSSTAVAYGATSRSCRRVRKSTRLDQSDSSQSHRSSDPSCDDHAAATRENHSVVVEECEATTENVKSDRMNAISRITKATEVSRKTA